MSCHRAFVDPKCLLVFILWVRIFSRVFHDSEIFSRGSKVLSRWYFVGPRFFLLGISWAWNICYWLLYGSKNFSCGYFIGPNFFPVGISWDLMGRSQVTILFRTRAKHILSIKYYVLMSKYWRAIYMIRVLLKKNKMGMWKSWRHKMQL